MSNHAMLVSLQVELSELSRKRKSLESDLNTLEQKINIVDQKLEDGEESRKMSALKDFLVTEKDRMHKNRLSKIDLQIKELQNKIDSFRIERTSTESSIGTSPRRNSEPLPLSDKDSHFHSHSKRHPHTSSNSKSYCTYCQENLVKKQSVPSVHNEQHAEWSVSHLPLCMSMEFCKECIAMKEFFMKMNKESKDADPIHMNCTKDNCTAFFDGKCDSPCEIGSTNSANSKEDVDRLKNEKKLKDFREMIKLCESGNSCTDCTILKERYENLKIDDINKLGTSEKFIVLPDLNTSSNQEQFDDAKSLSASLLIMCDSYALCECCTHNLTKLNMPTPSSSIVELTCASHENCATCAAVLIESSRRNSIENDQSSTKVISHEILFKNSNESNQLVQEAVNAMSVVSIKRELEDLTKYHPRTLLYEKLKKEIEFQSSLVYRTEEQLSKLAQSTSKEKLLKLRELETENLKFQDMIRIAKIEEKRPKDDLWWEETINN